MEQRGEATPREQRSKKAGPQPRGASDPQLLVCAGGGFVQTAFVFLGLDLNIKLGQIITNSSYFPPLTFF